MENKQDKYQWCNSIRKLDISELEALINGLKIQYQYGFDSETRIKALLSEAKRQLKIKKGGK